MKVYKKLFITQNTIVPKGAVQEKAIFKAEQGGNEYIMELSDCVKNEEAMEMSSIMFMLNKADSQDCIVTDPEVLKSASIWFNKHGKKELKFTHKGESIDADVMEIWIVKENDPIFSDKKYIGALASTAKFNDRGKWDLVKSENWETSIEGKVEEIEETETEKEDGLFSKILERLKKHFEPKTATATPEINDNKEIKKVEGVIMTKDEILAMLKEMFGLEPKVEEAPKADEVEAEKAELKKQLDEMKKQVEALTANAKKSAQTAEAKEMEKTNDEFIL